MEGALRREEVIGIEYTEERAKEWGKDSLGEVQNRRGGEG